MARQKASKKATPRATASAGIPKGFTRIEGFAQKWDYEAQPTLQGTWGKVREIEVVRGRKHETARCVDVMQANGVPVTVWESASLKPAFETIEEGAEVYIEYLGLGAVRKKGQNAPKLFNVAYR